MAERPLERDVLHPDGGADPTGEADLEPAGVDEQDIDEGLQHDPSDRADDVETVDDLTGSEDHPGR